MSLVGGAGSGLLIMFLEESFSSAAAKGLLASATRYAVILAALPSLLVVIMGRRWLESGKLMPAGVVALLSATMLVVYILRISSLKPAVTGPGVKDE